MTLEMENTDTASPPKQPKSWMIESILVTVLLFMPFGIVAMVNAANVKDRFKMGDYAGANKASIRAGKWTKIGLVAGLVCMCIYVYLFTKYIYHVIH